MLTIRLTRKGKKNQPFFRIVVIDKRRSSKGGRAVDEVGYLDPLTKRKSLKKERILHWISKGAQPSATIHNLLVREKIIDAPKISKFKKPARNVSSVADAGGPKKEPVVTVAAPAFAEATTGKPTAEKSAEAPAPASVEEVKKEEAQKEEVKP